MRAAYIALRSTTPPLLRDRVTEMARLKEHWAQVEAGRPRKVVVYGRRQVGKTFLLHHFRDRLPDDARSIYFTGEPAATTRQQLDGFLEAVRRDLPQERYLPERFDSWRAALTYVLDLASRGPVLLVIDELPYIIDADRTFAGVIQQAWDQLRLDTTPPRLMLATSGSAIATLTGLLSSGGPLYGRSDDELTIHPFALRDAHRHFLNTLSPADAIEAFAATGGYPRHLLSWDPGLSTAENLSALYGSPGGLLLRNGRQLLVDLPQEGGARAVLATIGAGDHRRSRISGKVGQRIERPLELLERSLLVRSERPVGSPINTPGRFVMADDFLSCWYALVQGDEGDIEAGLGESVLARRRGRWNVTSERSSRRRRGFMPGTSKGSEHFQRPAISGVGGRPPAPLPRSTCSGSAGCARRSSERPSGVPAPWVRASSRRSGVRRSSSRARPRTWCWRRGAEVVPPPTCRPPACAAGRRQTWLAMREPLTRRPGE